MTRLALLPATESRDGTVDRDEQLVNTLAEIDTPPVATVRPGLAELATGEGAGNGMVCFDKELVSVFGAALGIGSREVWLGGLVTEDTLPSSIVPYGISYGNSTWVIVGAVGGISPAAMYSADRVTWTATTFPSSFIPEAVGFIGGLFVALGSVYGGTNSSNYATSPDGITWTARTIPGGNTTLGVANPALGAGRLCFFAQRCITNEYSGVLSTADGLNWSITRIQGAGDRGGQIVYEGGYFVIFTGQLSAKSSDGVTWTTSLLGSPVTGWCSGICYAEGVYYAVGSASDFAESYDGLNWVALATELTPYDSPIVVSLLYNNNLFWACQQSSANLYVSDDMYVWTACPTTISTNFIRLQKTANGVFVVATAAHDKLCEVAAPYLGTEFIFTAPLLPGIYDFAQSPL